MTNKKPWRYIIPPSTEAQTAFEALTSSPNRPFEPGEAVDWRLVGSGGKAELVIASSSRQALDRILDFLRKEGIKLPLLK